MVRVKLNGIRYECAGCYEEIKTRQWVRILNEWDTTKDIADRDYFQLFNILSDSDFTDMARTVENEVTFHNAIAWILTQEFEFSKELPEVLTYKGKVITIPRDIGELSIGQSIHLRRDYIEPSKILQENISIAAAIYLQPIIDGGMFNMKRAVQIAKDFDEMPAYIIYPIGFFLLSRAVMHGSRPGNVWHRLWVSLGRKLAQMWRDLLRSTY